MHIGSASTAVFSLSPRQAGRDGESGFVKRQKWAKLQFDPFDDPLMSSRKYQFPRTDPFTLFGAQSESETF